MAGKPLLSGRSLAKYSLNGLEICSVSPLIPSLFKMVKGSASTADESYGLLVLFPHSFSVMGWKRRTREYEELVVDGLGMGQAQGENCDMLGDKINEAVARLKDILKDPKKVKELYSIPEGSEELEKSLKRVFGASKWEVLVLPVQARGTFALKVQAKSVDDEVAIIPMTFLGNVIDSFGKTYIGLRSMYRMELQRGDGSSGFDIHVDMTSGMNELTVLALLGARTFAEIYDCRLSVYRTDPYISDLTEHCGGADGSDDKRDEKDWQVSRRLPLSLTEVERFWDAFALIRSMISMLGVNYRSLTPELIGSGIEAVDPEIRGLGSLKGSDGSTWRGDLEELITSFRRLLCGVENTVIPYIHMALLELADRIAAVYESDNSLYRKLEDHLAKYFIEGGKGTKDECSEVTVLQDEDQPVSAEVRYRWFVGGLPPLLDALAKSIQSLVDGRFEPQLNQRGYRLRLNVGPFLDSELIADLLLYYRESNASTNLSLLIKELGMDIDKLSQSENEIRMEVENTLKTSPQAGSFYQERKKADFHEYVQQMEELGRKNRNLHDALNGFFDPVTSRGVKKHVGTYELFYAWEKRNHLVKCIDELRNKGRTIDQDKESTIRELTRYGNFLQLLADWSQGGSGTVDLSELRTKIDKLMDAVADLMGEVIDLEGKGIQLKVDGCGDFLRNFLKAKLLERRGRLGRKDIEELRRHVLAHIGLTHFTIKDIISGRIIYSRAFFERLQGDSPGGSICDG